MARTTTVPGDSLNGRSSVPLAPRPRPTTLMAAADTCGGAGGAGAAAGRCAPLPPRCCADTSRPVNANTIPMQRSEVPPDTRIRLREEVLTITPPMVKGCRAVAGGGQNEVSADQRRNNTVSRGSVLRRCLKHIVELVGVLAAFDDDRHRAGDARQLVGARVRHYGDRQSEGTVPHRSRVLQDERPPLPVQRARHEFERDIAP